MTSPGAAPRSASSTKEVVDGIGRLLDNAALSGMACLVVEGGGGQLGGFFDQLAPGGAALSSGR